MCGRQAEEPKRSDEEFKQQDMQPSTCPYIYRDAQIYIYIIFLPAMVPDVKLGSICIVPINGSCLGFGYIYRREGNLMGLLIKGKKSRGHLNHRVEVKQMPSREFFF